MQIVQTGHSSACHLFELTHGVLETDRTSALDVEDIADLLAMTARASAEMSTRLAALKPEPVS